jgi:hypothetical protein
VRATDQAQVWTNNEPVRKQLQPLTCPDLSDNGWLETASLGLLLLSPRGRLSKKARARRPRIPQRPGRLPNGALELLVMQELVRREIAEARIRRIKGPPETTSTSDTGSAEVLQTGHGLVPAYGLLKVPSESTGSPKSRGATVAGWTTNSGGCRAIAIVLRRGAVAEINLASQAHARRPKARRAPPVATQGGKISDF